MSKITFPSKPESFWRKTAKIDSFSSLNENEKVEIAVIGGGIAGILTAYELAKADKSVGLYEARKLISGTTGFTTAKLSAQHNLLYDDLIELYGEENARLYYDFNMAGIDRIKELAEQHQIECDLRKKSAYVYTEEEKNLSFIEKEAKAYDKLSINGNFTDKLTIDLPIAGAVVMHEQYEFQPVKFLAGMVEVLKKMDVKIYENTVITSVEENDAVQLTTNKDLQIECEKAICTSHYPVHDPDSYFTKKVEPEMSLATAYRMKKPFEGDMYISFDQPTRTIRGMSDGNDEYLLVGGESHSLGDGISGQARYENIAEFAQSTFEVKELYAYWSSHDYLTEDRMPFIGRTLPQKNNIFTITGLNKWGFANAASGARLIKDLILGKENNYEALFNPYREIPEKSSSGKEKSGESKQALNQKHPDSLKQYEATVIKTDDQKIGVYKDDQGKLHYLNISCTHMGCELGWNDGDKSWDCPCHGSRFRATGEVIAGPADKPLENL